MNKNKRYFLNLLKNAEFKIAENSKYIQELIITKKNELNKLKQQIKEIKDKLSKESQSLLEEEKGDCLAF